MSRDALVVGINTYVYEGLQRLRTPANDAEAIAQRLGDRGAFQVWRLPEFLDPFEDNARRVAHNEWVTLAQLEAALVQLFKPTGAHIPETALFFFSGHGLRKDRGIQEGFLATSDVNPAQGNWGLSLQWLRRLLQESPVRQQIVWLDCCYSGELLNFQEADSGRLGEGCDRNFIAAAREYEPAYEDAGSDHSVLSSILLAGLDPSQRADGVVTNFSLSEYIEQSPSLRSATQRPLFANSGNKIILIGQPRPSTPSTLSGVCPYKGLSYFDCDGDDPKYFYGRTDLTDSLLDAVRQDNFLALMGASGSGKSSVLRAGLLHQLKVGQRLSGSNQWTMVIARPGEHPVKNLALAFLEPTLSAIDRATQLAKVETLLATGATGLVRLAQATPHRLVLVIDQFEEVFTLCSDLGERQQFFSMLLGAVHQESEKLCVIVAMRADFFSKCLEQDYAGLAKTIETHLVTVAPMSREELTQAMTAPALQVGLSLETELVHQMLSDVENSPGSLPLVQYTLTQLWQHRSVNWLTLAAYQRLGGIGGTLQTRADEVYAKLSPGEKTIAQRIFLELTRLGDGTEDTRRQVAKQSLINAATPIDLIDRVIAKLSAERLIVTSELVAKGAQADRIEIIDVAHEALIRHWPQLRQWIDENRATLRQQRLLESAAQTWQDQGKPKQIAYLLQGRKLLAAEALQASQTDTLALSALSQALIKTSQAARRNASLRTTGLAGAVLAILAFAGFFSWQQWTKQRYADIVRDTAIGLVRPELLPIAQELQQKANRLANQNKVDQALINYQAVLNFTHLLQEQASQPQSLPGIDLAKVEALAQNTQASLVKLIVTHQLPRLATQLEQQQFGELNPSYSDSADIDTRFTEGALKTTFILLMQSSGAKADFDNDGLINDAAEAKRLPCDLLKALEDLWRKHSANQCGWYDSQSMDVYSAPDCDGLNGLPLTAALFEPPYDYVVEQLNTCQIAPQPLNANP